MAEDPKFQIFDYIVTAGVLAVPMAIGIVFAWVDQKKTSRLEYLLGGKQMTLIPVTLSLFVTFESAISLVGVPAEIYMYGTGFTYYYVALIISFSVLHQTFVPLMYPLEVTSLYEYLQLRFHSSAVRMLSTALACVETIFYMSITLLSPALVLQAAAGFPMWMSILVVGSVGTIYTVIGGIKSVIWTDVFQTVILFGGVLVIIIKGSIMVGGFGKAWSVAADGGRIRFAEFNPDPRFRMSAWGAFMGGAVIWFKVAFSQATLQRVRSLHSLRVAKLTHILNIPLNVCYFGILVTIGVITFAYFDLTQCDPYTAGLVANSNQIVPYFILQAMSDIPGMAGLYMATLFSASLSTLSSGINALAANTVEDILRRPLRNVSEGNVTLITKLTAALNGILICFLGYGAQYLEGSIVQITIAIFSAFGTPILGMFLLGCLVPWTNKFSALAGGIGSLIFNLWITFGAFFYGQNFSSLPVKISEECINPSSTLTFRGAINNAIYDFNDSSNYPLMNNSKSESYPILNDTVKHTATSNDYSFFLYDISHEWRPVFGLLLCLGVGLLVSLFTREKSWREQRKNSKLMFPFVRRYWFSGTNEHHGASMEMLDVSGKDVSESPNSA